MKEKTEEEGAEPKSDEIYGNVSRRSGENSQSLSVFTCLYLETSILLTLGKEIMMFR